MRNPERIDKFLAEVGKQWKRYPDFRFMQLIMNIQFERDPWFYEDNETIEILKKSMDQMLGEKENEENNSSN